MKKTHEKNLLAQGSRDVDLERRELWKDAVLATLGKEPNARKAIEQADLVLQDFDVRFVAET